MSGRPDDLGGLLALRERKRALDTTWLLTFVVLFFTIAVPWFLRVFDIDFGAVAWTIVAYASFHLGISALADRTNDCRTLQIVETGLQATGMFFLGCLWLLVGGVQTPLFLVVLVIPVVTSGLMMVSWQPYVLAVIGAAVAVVGSALSSPALRWYLVQLDVPLSGLLHGLPDRVPLLGTPYPGMDTQPAQVLTGLVVLTVCLLATATATDSLTRLLIHLHDRLRSSRHALAETESLAQTVLQASPTPAALVHRSSFQIVQASKSFLQHLLVHSDQLSRRSLFELIDFSFPDVIERAMSGGEIPFAVYRVDGETRVSRITVHPVTHEGTEYAFVTLHDVSDLYYLKSALDQVDDPYLLIGADRRLLYFNQATERVFDGVYRGAEAHAVLDRPDVPRRWWDPGSRGRLERQVDVAGTAYRVNLVAARIPGENGRFTVLSLRQVGR